MKLLNNEGLKRIFTILLSELIKKGEVLIVGPTVLEMNCPSNGVLYIDDLVMGTYIHVNGSVKSIKVNNISVKNKQNKETHSYVQFLTGESIPSLNINGNVMWGEIDNLLPNTIYRLEISYMNDVCYAKLIKYE